MVSSLRSSVVSYSRIVLFWYMKDGIRISLVWIFWWGRKTDLNSNVFSKTVGIKFFFCFLKAAHSDMTIYSWLITVLFSTFLTMIMVTFFCIESFIFLIGEIAEHFFMPVELSLVFKLHRATNLLKSDFLFSDVLATFILTRCLKTQISHASWLFSEVKYTSSIPEF